MKIHIWAVIVLGAAITCLVAPLVVQAAATPSLNSITLKQGVYQTTINSKKVTLTPFPGYSGKVWAKRVNFGKTSGSAYLFMQQSASTKASALKYYYHSVGSLRSLTPFYGDHKLGYNIDAVVQPKTKKVYLALGTKATGASARIMEVGTKSLKQINNPTVSATSEKGVVIVKFLKLYSDEYGLATMISGNPSTLKVWRYSSSTHRFDRDAAYDTSNISTIGNVLRLQS